MSVEKVRNYLKQFNADNRVIEFETSSATVELAAEAAGVIPARIAKSLTFAPKEGGCIVLVTAGDAKVAGSAFKSQFAFKPTMMAHDEALAATGHAVGGVCSFALPDNCKTYLDVSMKRFDTIFPACGSSNSAIELTCDELEKFSSNFVSWVDVCKGWRPEEQ